MRQRVSARKEAFVAIQIHGHTDNMVGEYEIFMMAEICKDLYIYSLTFESI